MAMSEKNRVALYLAFRPLAGDEAVADMLSHFPTRDVEEPVTKAHLRAEMANVRADFAGLRGEFADVRADFAALQTDIRAQMNRLLVWLMGTIIAAATLVVSATVVL